MITYGHHHHYMGYSNPFASAFFGMQGFCFGLFAGFSFASAFRYPSLYSYNNYNSIFSYNSGNFDYSWNNMSFDSCKNSCKKYEIGESKVSDSSASAKTETKPKSHFIYNPEIGSSGNPYKEGLGVYKKENLVTEKTKSTTEPPKAVRQTKVPYKPEGSSQKYSKIKTGLLKGNLVGKEDVIVELCKKYDVDVALAVTIIGLESGFGTSNLASHNNFMGYRAGGDLGKNEKGFGYFSTPEKGLEAAIKNLSKYPQRYASVKKADLDNIDAIGPIYCEGTTYASSIKHLYQVKVKDYLS